MSNKDRTVYRGKDGEWKNKRNGAERPATSHATQEEAYNKAREQLQNQGGGEVTVAGRNGKFRAKNTIAPGNDPFPPEG